MTLTMAKNSKLICGRILILLLGELMVLLFTELLTNQGPGTGIQGMVTAAKLTKSEKR